MKHLLPRSGLVAVMLLSACSLGDSPTVPSDPFAMAGPPPSGAPSVPSSQEQRLVAGRVLARFQPGASIDAIAAAEGATVQRPLGLGILLLQVASGRERVVAQALNQNPSVDFAEPDWFYVMDEPCGVGVCGAPTDELFGYRWDLFNDGTITDAQGVDLAATGSVDADMDWLEAFEVMGPVAGSVIIGIIDTGILSSHEDFAGKVVAGYDFFDMDPDAADDYGHGTHVAGIAAARGDNGRGAPGVAWMDEVHIAAAKVCGYILASLYGCPSSAIAQGIEWATDNGAAVLNLSLGGSEASSAVQTALQYARQNGALPFCAAGNDAGPVAYPGAFPECAAVSSTNWSDGLASYSNYGPEVQLAAPGGDFEHPSGYSYILSAYYASNTSYAWLLGTSMASPQAAGLAALLHVLGVTDPDAKLARMRGTANDLGAPGDDVYFGAGRINVYRAIADLVGAPTNQIPTTSFSYACDELTCAFTDTSIDGEGAIVAWSWDFGDGNSSGAQNPNHTFAAEGTYIVSLTATDDEGGAGTHSIELIVPIPNVPPVASFTSSCPEGDTCQFTDTSTDSDGTVVAWSWDFGDGASSNEQNPTHVYQAVATYAVTLVVTDDDGDSDTVSASVSASAHNDLPRASFSSSCDGLTCFFTDTSTDDDGSIVGRQWTFGDGWSSNSANPDHTYFDAGTYAVTLVVTDNIGAKDTTSAMVTAAEPGQAPTASFTTVCTDLSCDFVDTSTAGQGTIVTWSWDFGDGDTATVQHPSHLFAAAGTYTVTLVVTDDAGLSDTFGRGVTVPSVNQPPTASLTSSCAALTCSFTDTSSDGDGSVAAWSWDFGDGATSTEQSPTHTYSAPGGYTVVLAVTDDDGAADTVSANVMATAPNTPPTASFTWICNGLACVFTDTSTDPDGAITGRQWTFGDGWSSNSANPSHPYPDVGTYTVTLVATDNMGAKDTVSAPVTVVAPGDEPTASFTSSCVDLSCDFTDTSTEGTDPITSWSWDFGDGATDTAQHPSHTYAGAGTYGVTLVVADDRGVTGTFQRTVTVPAGNQAPSASFTWSCAELTCQFTDASGDGDGMVVAWSWDFGDGATATAQSPSHTFGGTGTFIVTLTVTDDDGATDDLAKSVSVVAPNQPPTASFSWSCTDLACQFTDTSTDGDGSIVNRQWTFGDGWSSNAASPSHTYGATGTYTVTLSVTDDDGATDTWSTELALGGSNQAPSASFTSSCTDLVCTFTDTSADPDGSIASWSWDFGDGGTSSSAAPTHTYTAPGTYTVTLGVTDDDGAGDTTSATVTVTAPPVIALTVTGYKVRGLQKADLSWSGASGVTVDVYRDGVLTFTTANDGFETDAIDARGSGSYAYRVCETGTTVCSAIVNVTF